MVKSFEEAMDKEAASCPTMGADQSPSDDMPDMRTNEEAGEQRKANIRKRMAREKEEKEAKMGPKMGPHLQRIEPRRWKWLLRGGNSSAAGRSGGGC